jgi:hypothetical protein
VAGSHCDEVVRGFDRFDPGWGKAALYFRTAGDWHFGHGGDELRTRGLLAIHQQLEERRRRYEDGNVQELLHAVMLCAEENLPMPTWLALAFRERFLAFLRPGGPTSLDHAFGSPSMPTSPIRASQVRRDWQIAGRLWHAVWKVARDHAGLDPAVKAVLKADKSFGVGLSRAKELVQMVDENQSALAGIEPLSRFWEKRRKHVR